MKISIISLLLLVSTPAYSSLNLGAFGGLSGTSLVAYGLDALFDTKGEFTKLAAEYGLLTGEGGICAELRSKFIGARIEGLYGYYKYRVFDLPNKAYTMYMSGAEIYFALDTLLLGGGGGVFTGRMWDEILGYGVTEPQFHKGFAAWIMLGWRPDEIFELNARFRWHHFTDIYKEKWEKEYTAGEEYEKLSNDYVFVLRAVLYLNII